jgi:hypothetical protein
MARRRFDRRLRQPTEDERHAESRKQSGDWESSIANEIAAKSAKDAKTGFRHCQLQTGNWKLAPAGRG